MGLSPWQLLMWIAGLELISIPLLIFLINSIIIGYFKIKEQHQAKMLKALGVMIESFGQKNGVVTDKIKEEEK